MSVAGILKPASSITYRSPLSGRETEITALAPEGVLVNEGDLVARLDTSELEAELLRAVQDARQAEVQEYQGLKPLLEKGFVTRDEFERSAAELEQAEAELALARRKAEIQVSRTRPREEQRAQLQLAQKGAQIENARARVRETAGRVAQLRQQIAGCSMYARAGGLVVYEDFLGASPRRKVRVGDRATASQGLVTIPEVARMVVEASVPEGEVHRVSAGQPATVRLDAFPGLVLTGRVSRVGPRRRARGRAAGRSAAAGQRGLRAAGQLRLPRRASAGCRDAARHARGIERHAGRSERGAA